jgi:hypothetical protein
MAQQPSQRNDGNGVHREDNVGRLVRHLDGNADGDEDEQEIDVARQQDVAERQEEAHNDVLLLLRRRRLGFFAVARRCPSPGLRRRRIACPEARVGGALFARHTANGRRGAVSALRARARPGADAICRSNGCQQAIPKACSVGVLGAQGMAPDPLAGGVDSRMLLGLVVLASLGASSCRMSD